MKTKDEKWIWVDPIPGTFVVNIGDMLTVPSKVPFVNVIWGSVGIIGRLECTT